MTAPMYFQWQNETLLKTIYPSRDRKLADFLVYYKEIDLWADYKDKQIENLQADVRAYTAERQNALMTAYKSYKTQYAYFLQEDVRSKYMAKYKLSDEAELLKLRELHRAFMTYLPKMADVRKEKYFVTQQVSQWEAYRKRLIQDIAGRQRRLNAMIPAHPRRPVETQELQKLQNITLPIVEEELQNLYSFVSTYNRIEKRKLELYKARESAQTGVKGGRTKLDGVRAQLKPVEAKQKELAAALARLKSPPSLASVEGYFKSDDISGHVRSRYPNADKSIMDMLNGIHKKVTSDLRTIKDDAVKLVTVRNHLYALQEQQRILKKEIIQLETDLRNMPANWVKRGERQARLDMLRDAGLKAVEDETDKLAEYQTAFEYSKKSQAELAQMIQAREKEMLVVQQRSSQLGKDASELEAQIKSLESILNTSEEEYLVQDSPDQAITVKDIVRGKVEAYKLSLAQKTHFALLEEIVKRFIAQPERYPLWLQYMVIHFSGMRYATAHGSWADPKDLLSSLRTSALEKDFKKMDDDTVQALSQERVSLYEATGVLNPNTPKLARTTDRKWKEKITFHLKGLKSASAHHRRKAFFDLRLDEEEYEVETMKPQEALDALELVKDTLPEWMWKEIVRLTDLRIKQAGDPNWEKLTPEEEEKRNEAQYAELRVIMSKWKQDNLTGWREEHDKSNRLIVTRSVCNEVAEQIQHLRGHTPPGGLTAKAPWYLKNEREGKVPGTPRPYFVKPASAKDYTVGASILWLRFVHELPNPWRVAQPLQTKQGDGLIPAQFLSGKSGPAGNWTYTQGNVVTRTRTRINEKKLTVKEQQWLRWIHEATVVDVAETADGPIVLTFETALPYDDPRLSSVGVFKHSLSNLMFNGGEETYNGSFVGYLPEGKVPADDLADMLDWNKVLLKQVLAPAQLAAYRKNYIQRK